MYTDIEIPITLRTSFLGLAQRLGENMTAFMEFGQQLEERPLPWLSQNEWSTKPTFDLSEAPFAQGDHLFGKFWVQHYLRDMESFISTQQELLPEQPPALAGAEVAVRYLPMMSVSGDYYDLLPFHERQFGLAIGDACGKGMGAAMLMTSLRANLRAQAYTASVGKLLAYLNRVIYRNTPKHQFVTLIYGIWDATEHTFTYSSAGHPPALHYQAAMRSVNELNVGGLVLGVCETAKYPTESVSLETGDALVLYTDGIIEAGNASDEMFGVHRLSEVVAAHGEESSEALATAILTIASQFSRQGWEDDVTLMVIKRTGA